NLHDDAACTLRAIRGRRACAATDVATTASGIAARRAQRTRSRRTRTQRTPGRARSQRRAGVGQRQAVVGRDLRVPVARVLHGPALGGVVDVDQTEPLGVAEAPLEVVEQ